MASFRTVQFLAAAAASAALLLSLSLVPSSFQTSGALDVVSPAQAQTTRRFNPTNLKGPKRTSGTGSRGCENQKAAIKLLPLVPDRAAGQTTAARPTFYISAEGVSSVEFTVVEPGKPKALVETTVPVPQDGIVALKVPETAPELQIGKDYYWTASLSCNPKRRSQDVAFVKANVRRVALTPAQSQQLAAAQDSATQSEVYLTSQVWYDAVASLAPSAPLSSRTAETDKAFLAMLKDVELRQEAMGDRALIREIKSDSTAMTAGANPN
jgi:hypothetical protein